MKPEQVAEKYNVDIADVYEAPAYYQGLLFGAHNRRYYVVVRAHGSI